jgi:YcaO-like protein with predicted kinase domain
MTKRGAERSSARPFSVLFLGDLVDPALEKRDGVAAMTSTFSLFGRELSAPKSHRSETHRVRSPAETFEAYSGLMSRMGITRVANITGLDSIKLPTYTAIRPCSRSLSTSQGKGLDDATAKTSALMESIECWHAENLEIPLSFESYERVRERAAVVDISRTTVATGRVLKMRTPLLWGRGEDLLRLEPVLVPYDLITMNTVTSPEYNPTFLISTTGLACGNHFLEAVVHGLCEVIERDAVAIWYATPLPPVLVDLNTVDDPACRRLLELVHDADSELVVWDITSDIGLATYACYILERPSRRSSRGLGFYHGFGSHLDPTVALFRAMIEAVQGRVTFISGSRDDLLYGDYVKLRDPSLLDGMWNEIEAGEVDAVQFGTRADLSTETFEGDLRTLLDAVATAGFDSVAVIDLSKDEIGIPVVKVVVPGLEDFFPEGQSGARVEAARLAGDSGGPD